MVRNGEKWGNVVILNVASGSISLTPRLVIGLSLTVFQLCQMHFTLRILFWNEFVVDVLNVFVYVPFPLSNNNNWLINFFHSCDGIASS